MGGRSQVLVQVRAADSNDSSVGWASEVEDEANEDRQEGRKGS